MKWFLELLFLIDDIVELVAFLVSLGVRNVIEKGKRWLNVVHLVDGRGKCFPRKSRKGKRDENPRNLVIDWG